MKRIKINARRASYLPILSKVINLTTGPVLELGIGNYSTNYLHWMCFAGKRKLVSYEADRGWFDYLKGFACDFHEMNFVEDWDKVDLSPPWEVAFVDHGPNERRFEEVKRLTHARFVVMHDTEDRENDKYKFREIESLFKFRYRYTDAMPNTSVWSNSDNLENLWRLPMNGSPPPVEIIEPVSEKYLTSIADLTGINRPYTACIALAQIYKQIEDPEIRLKLRYASTIIKYTIMKLREYNPTWMKAFYPRFKDYDRLMRGKK